MWLSAPRLGVGEPNKAAESLARRAYQAGSDDPTALAQAAGVLAHVGDAAAAINLIERALAANPNSSLSWQWNGWIHVFLGEPDLAIGHLEKALLFPYGEPVDVSYLHNAEHRDFVLSALQVIMP